MAPWRRQLSPVRFAGAAVRPHHPVWRLQALLAPVWCPVVPLPLCQHHPHQAGWHRRCLPRVRPVHRNVIGTVLCIRLVSPQAVAGGTKTARAVLPIALVRHSHRPLALWQDAVCHPVPSPVHRLRCCHPVGRPALAVPYQAACVPVYPAAVQVVLQAVLFPTLPPVVGLIAVLRIPIQMAMVGAGKTAIPVSSMALQQTRAQGISPTA